MGRPRILLADDRKMVVAFRKLLQPEFDIVGSVSDGSELLRAALALRPDVIVVNLEMPMLSGMDAGRQLKYLLPSSKLIALTTSEDWEDAAAAVRSWASGYLLRKSAGAELVKAIREALAGKSYVTPRVAQHLLDLFIRNLEPTHDKELTARQRQVLQLLAEGRTMREAAEALRLSPRTIAFHKYRIMEEFGLKTNSDLVKFALRERLVSPR